MPPTSHAPNRILFPKFSGLTLKVVPGHAVDAELLQRLGEGDPELGPRRPALAGAEQVALAAVGRLPAADLGEPPRRRLLARRRQRAGWAAVQQAAFDVDMAGLRVRLPGQPLEPAAAGAGDQAELQQPADDQPAVPLEAADPPLRPGPGLRGRSSRCRGPSAEPGPAPPP
jgi:hypothetical protein